ncbi:MAG: hypothetical protein FWE71_08710 [Nocardioidaceae bacterium]|nr:hypothetical protein [Nocardioidaceae bacterium]MCL2612953.1 hypothetical protein [Nocardioidaceae bacterium]
MRRIALLVSGTVAAAMMGSVLPTVGAHAASAPAHKLKRSPYAYTAGSYGTQVRGGSLPAGSDKTAYADISCQDQTGINRTNDIASVDLKGLGTVQGVQSRVWTTKSGDTYAANSQHKIAGITLLQSAIGKLQITGLESQARAWHDATGFHATTHTQTAAIKLTLPNGKGLNLNLPSVGHPVVVPGVLKLELGSAVRHQDRHHILVRANSLKITLIPTNTEVRIAQTRAGVNDGIETAVFGGFGAALQASVLSPIVSTGRVPNQPMPCQGTQGVLRTRSTAGVNIPGVATISGVSDQQRAQQTKTRAWGMQRAKVASVSLLGGRVQVTGVQGQVNVTRTGSKLQRNTQGTQTLSVTLDGKALALPDLGKLLTIPNLLSIRQDVRRKIPDGFEVIALQIKLLDGTGATINLGTAHLKVHKA